MYFRRFNKINQLSLLLSILFTVLLMSSCTGEPQKPADLQGDDYAYTKEWATWYITNELMKKANVPGVVVALVDDQEVVWQEAFGYANLEEEIFASGDTVHRIASITKTFTLLL